MNLFLTSASFQDFQTKQVRKDLEMEFRKQCDGLKSKKTCLIYTIRQESDRVWLNLYDEELKALDLPYETVNISEEIRVHELPEYDIYYVCGGNTFYILDRLRKTGMDIVLQEAVQRGKIYIGVSAGSTIVGPDISVSGLVGGENADVNDINLSNLTGFSWVPFHISPHYTHHERKDVEKFFESRREPVIALTDEQAIVVTGKEVKLVGNGEGIQLGNILLKK